MIATKNPKSVALFTRPRLEIRQKNRQKSGDIAFAIKQMNGFLVHFIPHILEVSAGKFMEYLFNDS